MIGLQPGSELPIHDTTGKKTWGLRVDSVGNDLRLVRYDSDGFYVEDILVINWADGVITFTHNTVGE